MIGNEINQIYIIFKRDLLLSLSYKFRFIYTISFIFFQLLIFYFLSKFINVPLFIDENTLIKNAFGYFLLGICILDLSFTIISTLSIQIEEFKKIGVIEDIFSLPISPINYFIYSHIYSILFSFFKLLIYLIAFMLTSNLNEINITFWLILFLVTLLGFISFIGISLIAISLTIFYYRGSWVSAFHNLICTVFGGIIYPPTLIHDLLLYLKYILPAIPILELFRANFQIYSNIDDNFIYEHLIILIFQSMIYFLIGYHFLKFSLRKAFIDGKIANY